VSDRKERRDRKRYYFKALLQLADSGEYSNVNLESINISAGGIFFRSSQMLDINKEIRLVFTLPGRKEPVEARCLVVHNLETIPGKQYFIGARFIDLDGISPKELSKYLEERFE
jgi:c-di-GMP-binding flagellar brake protein YcgR